MAKVLAYHAAASAAEQQAVSEALGKPGEPAAALVQELAEAVAVRAGLSITRVARLPL